MHPRTTKHANGRFSASSHWRTRSPKLLITLALLLLVSSSSAIAARANGPSMAGVGAAAPRVRVKISDADLQPISPFIWSLNLNPPVGYTTAAQFFSDFDPEMLRRTGVQGLRFYGGCLSQQYDWRTPKLHRIEFPGTPQEREVIRTDIMGVDEALAIAREAGAQLLYQVNITKTGENADGCAGGLPAFDSTVTDALDLLARYPEIQYVELGNEPQFRGDAEAYADRVLEYATAIRSAFPTVKISAAGIPANGLVYDPASQHDRLKGEAWTRAVQRMNATRCLVDGAPTDCIDYFTIHQYGRTGYDPDSTVAWNMPGIAAYYPLANLVPVLQKLSTTSEAGRVSMNEWNARCFDGKSFSNPAAGTIEHGFYVLSSQLLMAQSGTQMASLYSFSVRAGKLCSMLTSDGGLNTIGSMFELTAPLAGGTLLQSSVTHSPLRRVPKDMSCYPHAQVICMLGGDFPVVTAYSAYNASRTVLHTYVLNTSGRASKADLAWTLTETQIAGANATVTTLSADAFTDTSFTSSISTMTLKPTNRVVVPARGILRIDIPVTPVH